MKGKPARVLISERVEFIPKEELSIIELEESEEVKRIEEFYEEQILNRDDEEIEGSEEDEIVETEKSDSDLVMELSLCDCIGWGGVSSGDLVFILQWVREYVDHLVLHFYVDSVKNYKSREVEVTIPAKDPTNIYQFEIDGHMLRLDLKRRILWSELMQTDAEWIDVNPWVCIAKDYLFCVEKEYAEHNLSQECLDYAALTRSGAGYYYWKMEEGHHAVVLAELRTIFWEDSFEDDGTWAITENMEMVLKLLREYCHIYCIQKKLGSFGCSSFIRETVREEAVENGVNRIYSTWKENGFIERFMALQKEILWEPEK